MHHTVMTNALTETMTTPVITDHPASELQRIISHLQPPTVTVVTDSNVATLALPLLQDALSEHPHTATVIMPSGEEGKDISHCERIWHTLTEQCATRRSLVVCVGGGMVSDLGGFAAATYKRGIASVNMPTTLLAAVDASIGGKTAINFSGIKNSIGAFHMPRAVIVSPRFFATLPTSEYLSGMGEMLKHALLDTTDHLTALLHTQGQVSPQLLQNSISVKQRIVVLDPTEQSLRKALNLGHTIGHALEEIALDGRHPLPHGHAVAYGLVGALVLSHLHCGFPSDRLLCVAQWVKQHYPQLQLECRDYDRLISLMRHDKKNPTGNQITFTLLRDIGVPLTDRPIAHTDIRTALDITRDLL